MTHLIFRKKSDVTKPAVAANKPTGASFDRLGASFAPASAALKAKFGVKSGVIVTGIEQGKLFDAWEVPKGVVITSVNGQPVNSSKDVETALPNSRNGMTTITGVGPQGTFTYSVN